MEKAGYKDRIQAGLEKYYMNSGLLTGKVTKLFAVQLLTSLTFSMQADIDGIILANSLGERAYAVIGLYKPVNKLPVAITYLAVEGFGYVFPNILAGNDSKKREEALSAFYRLQYAAMLISLAAQLVFAFFYYQMLDIDPEMRSMLYMYSIPMIAALSINVFDHAGLVKLGAVGLVNVRAVLEVSECIMNAVLDYLFINVFSMGTFGAGLATLVAVAVSVAVIRIIIRRTDILQYKKVPCRRMMKDIAASGMTPAGRVLANVVLFAALDYVLLKTGGPQAVAVFFICFFSYEIALNVGQIFYNVTGKFAGFYRTMHNAKGGRIMLQVCLAGTFILSVCILILYNAFPDILFRIYGMEGIPDKYILFYRIMTVFIAADLLANIFMEYFAGLLYNRFVFITRVIARSSLLLAGILLSCHGGSAEVIAVAHAVTAAVILVTGITVYCIHYLKERQEYENRTGISTALSLRAEEGTDVSELLFEKLKDNPQITGIAPEKMKSLVYRLALAVEEYAGVILDANKRHGVRIDVLLDIGEESARLYFMHDGKPITVKDGSAQGKDTLNGIHEESKEQETAYEGTREPDNNFMLERIMDRYCVSQFFELNFVSFEISLKEKPV